MVRIHFECFCPTQWGQEILIYGSVDALGSWNIQHAIPMKCHDLNRWRVELEIAGDKIESFEYKYLLFDRQHQTVEPESRKNRSFDPLAKSFTDFYLIDNWQKFENRHFSLLSSAFTEILYRPDKKFTKKAQIPSKSNQLLEFKVITPQLNNEDYLAISGGCEALGHWDPEKSIALNTRHSAIWSTLIDGNILPDKFEYKFIVKNNKAVIWESGQNRLFAKPTAVNSDFCIRIDAGLVEILPKQVRYAGTSIPVFSLRTDNSFGAGDFSDLKQMIDWSADKGLKMIQILPINDTISTFTFLDSYPYKAISVFALHPLYLDIFRLGKLKEKKQQLYFEKLKTELNSKPAVDYEKVVDAKMQYCHIYFNEHKDEILDHKDYKLFFKENKNWLISYAAFSVLRDTYKTSDFSRWGKYKVYRKTDIDKLTNEKSESYHDILFYYFLQYFLDRQLKETSEYAHDKGIILKGDIPIGISRYSVDAWANPELFHFNGQAGAPPDDFSVTGQNWGFPTYNWEVMEKDHFAWWRNRLTKMNDFFDAYRIDHILGFFRIWEIPFSAVEGILGHFRPALPLSVDEIQLRGAWFDYNRLCRPYIREHMIHQLFGEASDEVKQKYLIDKDHGIFDLKEEFSNQRKIYDALVDEKGPEALPDHMRNILYGLMRLAAEVVLVPDDNEGFYHPRISMHSTFAYQELDGHQKHILDLIYIDFFYHRHETFWKQQAMQKMPALVYATDMLICGEDLGMIPASVPIVMNHFGILSLEIQRMPKNPKKEFAHPADAPYLSVCTPSTHDMSSIRGWWEENREVTQRFYNQQLGQWGEAPQKANIEVCKAIISQHLHSPAMWVVIPMQDLLSMDESLRIENAQDERINEPANPRHYWKYRMHLSMEELKKATNFNQLLQRMIHESDRC